METAWPTAEGAVGTILVPNKVSRSDAVPRTYERKLEVPFKTRRRFLNRSTTVATTTASVPPERMAQGKSTTEATATVSVPPERRRQGESTEIQSFITEDDNATVSVPHSGLRNDDSLSSFDLELLPVGKQVHFIYLYHSCYIFENNVLVKKFLFQLRIDTKQSDI